MPRLPEGFDFDVVVGNVLAAALFILFAAAAFKAFLA